MATKTKSALDEMRERGGRDVQNTFSPSLKLTNKEGTPGAWFRGIFKETRMVIQEKKKGKNVVKVERPVHTFTFLDASVVPTIKEGDDYVEVNKSEIVNKNVDIWGGGQLSSRLEKANIGDEVGIEYLGKEEVEGFEAPLNQFAVVIVPAA